MTKLRNIEFLRIFFAIAIVYFHIFHPSIMSFTKKIQDPEFTATVNSLFVGNYHAWMLVEAFVIISGFFLYQKLSKKSADDATSWGQFAVDKLLRLYPAVAFSIFITVVLHFCGVVKLNLYTLFLNLITLQCIGVNLKYQGITWFVSSYFWTMLLIYGMYKALNKKVFHLILAVLVYFSYVILVERGFGRETVNDFINLGVARMVASLGLGYFLGMFHDKIKDAEVFSRHRLATCIGFSVVEIVSFACVVNWTLVHKISYGNKFIFIPVFVILILSFAMNKGVLSKITNLRGFEKLGRYSYSIYVMQSPSFWLLGLFLWNQKEFLHQHFALTIVLSLLFSCALGVVSYYFVERPVIRWYKARKHAGARQAAPGQ